MILTTMQPDAAHRDRQPAPNVFVRCEAIGEMLRGICRVHSAKCGGWLPGCARDSPARATLSPSYRFRLTNYLRAKLLGQGPRREDIDGNTKAAFELDLNLGDVEQGGVGGGIHEEVQVAVVRVGAMRNGAENTWIACAMGSHDLPNGFPVHFECCGWFHR